MDKLNSIRSLHDTIIEDHHALLMRALLFITHKYLLNLQTVNTLPTVKLKGKRNEYCAHGEQGVN